MYEALGCLRHASKLTKFVFNQHLTFHLLHVFDEENVRNIYIKKAPAHSFSIRNSDKKCFFFLKLSSMFKLVVNVLLNISLS